AATAVCRGFRLEIALTTAHARLMGIGQPGNISVELRDHHRTADPVAGTPREELAKPRLGDLRCRTGRMPMKMLGPVRLEGALAVAVEAEIEAENGSPD